MTRKVCIFGGATTPFDYGPTGFENIEQGAAYCMKEAQQYVPEEVVASTGVNNRNNTMDNPTK